MLKWMVPKAILVGVLVNLGAYMGIWFVYNIALVVYNLILSNIKIIDIDLIFNRFYNSGPINWAMAVICCSVTLAGNYLSGRLAKGSEWLIGGLVFFVSLGGTYWLGWKTTLSEGLVVAGIAFVFALMGSYFAFQKNRQDSLGE